VTEPSPPNRRPSWIAWIALAILVIAAFAVWNRHRFEFDDAYISYRYAVNLATGHGLVFNPGERVEGYSNFLWVLLLAGVRLVGIAPHVAAPWLGVACFLATLVLCWATVWWPNERRRSEVVRGVMATLVVGVLVSAHGFAATAGSGLETHLFALLVVATGVVLMRADLQRAGSLLAFGALPAALLLTRPDGLVPAVTALAVVVVFSAVQRDDWRIGLLSGAIAAAPAIVAGCALALFKLTYFGDLIPNPYYAKGADALHIDAGFAYLWGFLRSYPFVAVAIVLAVVVAARRGTAEPVRRLAVFTVLTCVAYGGFLIKVGGDFMEYRLALHLMPLIVLTAAVAAMRSIRSLGLLAAVALLVVALSFRPFVPETRYYMQDLAEMNRYVDQGTRVGKALAGLPPDTRIATTLIGTIGYFSDRIIVDQWGLVDARVRDRAPRRRFFRGHVRYTNAREAERLGAQLLLDHPHICRCSSSCLGHGRDVLIAIGDGACVRARVLDLDGGFLSALTADPDRCPVVGSAIRHARPDVPGPSR
jgi:hypothetical protein